jgi:hypothetical protein
MTSDFADGEASGAAPSHTCGTSGAAMPHGDACRGKEGFHACDALNGRCRRRWARIVEVGQSVDLLGIENGVPLHEGDRVLALFAGMAVHLGADVLTINEADVYLVGFVAHRIASRSMSGYSNHDESLSGFAPAYYLSKAR